MALRSGQRDVSQAIAAIGQGTGRRSKYNAIRVTVDGITFDSKKEAKRWSELLLLARAGEITDLMRQPAYDIVVTPIYQLEPVIVGRFTADFFYWDHGVPVVEDVKSPATQKNTAYRLRKRLVEARYGVTVREI